MASAYFRQFAIDNHLTVDYGYMYGNYKNLYISLKESLGSTKILSIVTSLGKDKENLRKILSVFNENELPKYCISDLKVADNHLQFTFELSNEKAYLIAEFLDKFIESCINNNEVLEITCSICGKKILENEHMATIDIAGLLQPAHESCYESKKSEVKKQVNELNKEINKDTKGYRSGLVGSLVYGLIYLAVLIVSFFFVQFILNNAETNDSFVTIFQYFPVIAALLACPIVYAGYDKFKGKKGPYKYIIILWTVIITTIVGTFLGFVTSLLLVADSFTLVELFELVGKLITCKDINGSTSFRFGFYIYIFVALGLSILSMVFKFSGKAEMDEANSNTFEKLD